MEQEPVRAFRLAKQLNVETSDLLAAAQSLGIDLKNHLSQVPPDRQAALEEYARKMVPQPATSAPPPSLTLSDADADDLDDFEDDLDEGDFDEDDDVIDEDDEDEDGGGGFRVDHTEEREDQEDFEPEEDDKDSADYEADGPEEYGCDPDYD